MLQAEPDSNWVSGVHRKSGKLSVIKLEKCLYALFKPSYSSYLRVFINYGLHFLEKLTIKSALTHSDTVGCGCDGRSKLLKFREYRSSAEFVVFALLDRLYD